MIIDANADYLEQLETTKQIVKKQSNKIIEDLVLKTGLDKDKLEKILPFALWQSVLMYIDRINERAKLQQLFGEL